jgi:hypothetical protein
MTEGLNRAVSRWYRTAEKEVSRGRETVPSNRESNSPLFRMEIEVETPALRRATARRRGRFLKGPIPMWRIAEASRMPGRALALLLAIHHQSDLTGRSTVTLPRGLLGDLGIGKDAKARALLDLERAGLVTVQRSKGRSARITLLS